MRKAAVILGLTVLLLAAFAAWQITACYVANSELQSDMKDFAVQNGARIGLVTFSTEEELRNAVVARAKEHGIQLAPEQVTVQRTLTPGMLEIPLAADYEARVNLLGFSFTIHFTPSSSYRGEIVVK
jgi:hypothetical protein